MKHWIYAADRGDYWVLFAGNRQKLTTHVGYYWKDKNKLEYQNTNTIPAYAQNMMYNYCRKHFNIKVEAYMY